MVKKTRLKKRAKRFDEKIKSDNKKLFSLEKFVSSPSANTKYHYNSCKPLD